MRLQVAMNMTYIGDQVIRINLTSHSQKCCTGCPRSRKRSCCPRGVCICRKSLLAVHISGILDENEGCKDNVVVEVLLHQHETSAELKEKLRTSRTSGNTPGSLVFLM